MMRHAAQFSRPLCVAANEDAAADAANEAIAGVFSVIQGGNMVVPFAERAVMASVNGRNMRVLQRIDAQAGNSMREDLGGWLKKKLVGRPIFLGHPYHADPVEAAKWPDKRSRGTIRGIAVSNEGITLVPGYNGLGRTEVDDGQFLYHSPQWRMEPVMGANGRQEIKDGMPVFRPTSLHSAGLTNNPNLDVPSLVAANEDGAAVSVVCIDVNKIIAALVDLGVIKEGDDETAILSAVSSLQSTLQWARDARAREEREMALLREKCGGEGANEMPREELLNSLLSRLEAQAANEAGLAAQVDEFKDAMAGAKVVVEAANERFKAARTARVNDAIAALIKGGHIPNAAREMFRTELVEAANEADITTRLQELTQKKTRLGTSGGVTDEARGGRRLVMAANEQAVRSQQRTEAVNQCLKEITGGGAARPGDQERAWNLASSRNPELFKQ